MLDTVRYARSGMDLVPCLSWRHSPTGMDVLKVAVRRDWCQARNSADADQILQPHVAISCAT